MAFETELNNCNLHLGKGHTILYPTDTLWGIGCDATNMNAVKKIYEIKQREASKSLITLVSSIDMLAKYVENIPKLVLKFLSDTTQPTTVIYTNPKGIASNAIAKDNTIAIRIIPNGFAHELIELFGKPIISTSANISGKSAPQKHSKISNTIIKSVDYSAKVRSRKSTNIPSKIITLKDGEILILRD